MNRLNTLTLVSFALSFLIWVNQPSVTESFEKTPKEWMKNSETIHTPKEHIRPGDQTFLTYPEWFLVHSPAEEAEYLKTRTSTTFPFLGHIEQLWKSYAIVYEQIKDDYELNVGYHVMILVIATSTTAEYGAKAIYETMIGRVTDTNIEEPLTAEDKFQARVTMDYVNFIRQTPWYEFDFATALKELWIDVPYFETNLIRKWERRYFLTSDLGVKAVYGWLIKKATKAAYEDPILGTAIVTDNPPKEQSEKVKLLENISYVEFALLVPRYGDFNPTVTKLAQENINFKEVAGNTSAILFTILVPKDWKGEDSKYKIIFSQPVLTRPEEKRVAITLPVKLLAETLRELKNNNILIEHIYDF